MRFVTLKRAILTTALGIPLLAPSALQAQGTRAPSHVVGDDGSKP